MSLPASGVLAHINPDGVPLSLVTAEKNAGWRRHVQPLGKGVQETFLLDEPMDPPQPGPEQQVLSIKKVNSFNVQIKVRFKFARRNSVQRRSGAMRHRSFPPVAHCLHPSSIPDLQCAVLGRGVIPVTPAILPDSSTRPL